MAYDQAIADQICSRIAEGEPLTQICRSEGFPAWRTVYDWLDGNSDFAAGFARARARGFDVIAEGCLSIADNTSQDTVWGGSAENPREVANTEWISRSKLRVETRLKLLAKWDPKRYGEKLAIGGADDLPPIRTMSDEQLAARVKALQDKVNGNAG